MGGPAVMTVLRRRGSTKSLDRPWREKNYAVVDLETTGPDLRRDTMASYGIAPIRGERMVVDCCRWDADMQAPRSKR